MLSSALRALVDILLSVDEREALGEDELARLQLPDASREVDRIIERNLPDEPPKRRQGTAP